MSERTGEGASWLPAEPTAGEELAEERTRLMTAAAESRRSAPLTPDEADGGASWLPRSEPPAPQGEPAKPEARAEAVPDRWLPTAESAGSTAVIAEPESPVPSPTPPAAGRQQALAVEAYCRELCPPETAGAAAAEALDASPGAGDDELLRRTRVIAAKHAVAPARRGRRRGPPRECAPTLGRLGARANNELDPDERDALERHLESCLGCQAAELRSRRAERAFVGVAGIELARDEPARVLDAIREPEAPAPRASQPPPASTSEAVTGQWMPVAAPAVTASPAADLPAVTATPPADLPAATPPKRHRRPVGVFAVASAVAAAAVVAALLLSGGHSHKSSTVARSTIPAPTTSTPAPTHHKAVVKHRVSKKHHVAAKKPAVHHAASAASAASATPATASVTPAASATPSAPAPAPAPAPTSSSSSSSGSSSSPSVSIQQGSLGSTSAKQGVK